MTLLETGKPSRRRNVARIFAHRPTHRTTAATPPSRENPWRSR